MEDQKPTEATEAELEQMMKDDSATFVLAGCAIDLYSYSMLKNKELVMKTMARIGQVLALDSTYLERYRQKRTHIIDMAMKMQKTADLQASAE